MQGWGVCTVIMNSLIWTVRAGHGTCWICISCQTDSGVSICTVLWSFSKVMKCLHNNSLKLELSNLKYSRVNACLELFLQLQLTSVNYLVFRNFNCLPTVTFNMGVKCCFITLKEPLQICAVKLLNSKAECLFPVHCIVKFKSILKLQGTQDTILTPSCI